MKLELGQTYITRDSRRVNIHARTCESELGPAAYYGHLPDNGVSMRSGLWCWREDGSLAADAELDADIVSLVDAGDSHDEATFHALPVVDAMRDRTHGNSGIGDIKSDAKGSGARYNAGKVPFDLVPLTQIGWSILSLQKGLIQSARNAAQALVYIGEYQSRERGVDALYDALWALAGEGDIEDVWDECARVFEYGAQKYASWNWAKGMAWSVPIACAARHCLALTRAEMTDIDKPGPDGQIIKGSQLPHRGHVACNIVMLIAYATTYLDGDDRPAAGLLAANDAHAQAAA